MDTKFSIGAESSRGSITSAARAIEDGQLLIGYNQIDSSRVVREDVTNTMSNKRDARLYIDSKAGTSSVIRLPVNAFYSDYSQWASCVSLEQKNTTTGYLMFSTGTDTTPFYDSNIKVSTTAGVLVAQQFSGVATLANKLTTATTQANHTDATLVDKGASNKPVYFVDGVPVEADDYTTLFTALTSTGTQNISLTIGGTTHSINDLYATFVQAEKKNTTQGYLLGFVNGSTAPIYDENIYLSTTSGLLVTKSLKISSTSDEDHLAFTRGGVNFVMAPSSGSIAFCVNGVTRAESNSQLKITGTALLPGKTDTTDIGSSTLRWNTLHAKTANFYDLNVSNESTLTGTVYLKGGSAKTATLKGPDTNDATFLFPNTGGTLVTHPERGTKVGSSTYPVYIAATGVATQCSQFAGGTQITSFNGESKKAAAIANLYAPTTAGTSGYILSSNGSGAPSWVTPSLASTAATNLTLTINGAATTLTNVYASYLQTTAATTTTKYYVTGVASSSASTGCSFYVSSGAYLYNSVLYGACWNDYAEYRAQAEKVEPGYCVASNNQGQVYKTTEKYQACDGIVSDTYGFAIGETEDSQTPLAVAGRVLAYCEGDRYDYHAGDTVCASSNGKVCKMNREEIAMWPDRIVGIVSEIPEYETWGTNNIEVNGRIWIKIK